MPSYTYVCGLYYTLPDSGNRYLSRNYLPQVDTQAHTTILSNTSKTTLTQTFLNPSDTKGIKEARYTFPLYEGVSVAGFTCRVGDQVIVGEVKEKEKARKEFKEAVERGEAAGLLEQLPNASDVFTTTVGNIAPAAKVVVEITYLGELKHDAEVDGLRFTLPQVICPRYGDYPGELKKTDATDALQKGVSITVDVDMADGSPIQQIRSPSHPISVSMGTISVSPDSDPSMTKASATLSLQDAQWDKDFVLQVMCKNVGLPKAILETHSTIPNQRALMATLVPKFSLPPEKPEIVFICDRSGSMAGSRMELAIKALHLFLKSLPLGVTFNICSFGSSYVFLWEKSKLYSQSTLEEAVNHIQGWSSNLGGTEMFNPIMKTLQNRHKDTSLAVMLLTDGEIWDQQLLFSYLNKEIIEERNPVRVFTLGVGNGVSHSLIEGIARSGNGFSQAVGEGEKMDSKVIRMLKAGLAPLVDNYTLEVKYETEDDFELVEKVADSMKAKLQIQDDKEKEKEPQKPTSLFDPSADIDQEIKKESLNEHLPTVSAPRILQSPHRIPQLYAWNRTSVYLLLGPDAPQGTPKSVILRGTSRHGPLELEIPIEVLEKPGEHIHKLAAKKAIAELEQGRGWLTEAKDESGTLLKEKLSSRFEGIVEREGVRLGVQFQVASKWSPFVAVQKKSEEKVDEGKIDEDFEWIDEKSIARKKIDDVLTRGESDDSVRQRCDYLASSSAAFASVSRTTAYRRLPLASKSARKAAPPTESIDYSDEEEEDESSDEDMAFGLFDGDESVNVSTQHQRSAPPAPQTQSFGQPQSFGMPQNPGSGGGPFGVSQYPGSGGGPFGVSQNSGSGGGLFGQAQSPGSGGGFVGMCYKRGPSGGLFGHSQNPAPASQPRSRAPLDDDGILNLLVSLQTFEGYWGWDTALFTALKVKEEDAQKLADEFLDKRVVVTALVVRFLEEKLKSKKDVWELFVEKARGWLDGVVGDGGAEVVVGRVGGLV